MPLTIKTSSQILPGKFLAENDQSIDDPIQIQAGMGLVDAGKAAGRGRVQ